MSTSRLDGWVNRLTDLGHAFRDKSKTFEFFAGSVLTPQQCENLYHHDDLANRIVSAVPDEALRQGLIIDGDRDRLKEINRRLSEISCVNAVHDGMIWGRCKGGAAILPIVLGAGDLSEPLDESQVERVEELRIIDREELQVQERYSDPTQSNYEKPRLYRYSPIAGNFSDSPLIHESRLIIFGGVHTSKRAKKNNSGWDYSVLQRVYDVLMATNSNWQNVVHMMNDFSQAVFKINGLIAAIEEGKGDLVSMRMALMDRVRAVSKALVLDAGDPDQNIPSEEFSVVERGALLGIDAILQQSWLRLATAARMPVSILMGQAPAGLNATGSIDLRWWYDTIQTAREYECKPRIERIVRMVSYELYGDAGEYEISFPSLWQMTPTEEADLRAKVAATDAIYIDRTVALPEEIALSRWGAGKYSTETVLDIDARKEILAGTSSEPAIESTAPDIESPAIESTPALPSEEEKKIAEETGVSTGVEKDPNTAFNGAQVASLISIVNAVSTKQIPRATGVEMILLAFPVDRDQAESVMGDVGNTFFAQEETPGNPPETTTDASSTPVKND